MRVRVEAGGRLHFGFQNLSLAHERLYGGVGVALAEPRVELTAEPAESVVCSDPLVADCAAAACEQTTDSAGSAVNSTRGSARATPTPP